MKRIPVIMIFLSLVLYGKAENPPSDKDKAVACIKRWEGWHRGKMPYIGYGHRLQGICIVPLLSGESHSRHREKKKRGV